MFKKLAAVLAIISLVVPVSAFALGLGTIELNSALNQPLHARIPLLRVRPGELQQLTVSLATSETFMEAGIDRPAFLSQLKFEVIAPQDRSPYVLVTSRKPITEPFLNILVEVVWPHGRLLREFTVLVDPPLLTDNTGGGVQPPASFEPDIIETQEIIDQDEGSIRQAGKPPKIITQVAGEKTPDKPEMEVPPEPASMETTTSTTTTTVVEPEMAPIPDGTRRSDVQGTSRSLSGGGFEYHTKRGDTLWEIARKMRGNNTDVTVEQMMIAMLRANPDSFYRDNINNLKQGFVLRIDDMDQVRAVGKTEASRLTRAQWEEWKSHRSTMVGSTSSSTRVSSAGKTSGPKVKLVSPGEGDVDSTGTPRPVGDDGGASSEQLSLLSEQLDATEQENKELQSRLDDRESQVEKLERLVELQSDQLSDLQKELGKEVEVPTMEQVEAEMQKEGGEEAVAAEGETGEDAGKEPVAPTPAPAPAPAPDVTQPKPPAPTPVPAPPQGEKDLVTTILDTVGDVTGKAVPFVKDNLTLVAAGGGGLLVLILVIWGLKRRRGMSSFQESILTGKSSLGEHSDFSSAESGSLMSDFAVSTMEGIEADVDDVDPISEADVYLVYNQFDQARSMLAEHMQHGNEGADLKLKMLEVLQAGAANHEMDEQKEEYRSDFETRAAEYKSVLNKGQWDEVCAWATALGCSNDIFTSAHEGPADEGGIDMDMGLDMDSAGGAAAEEDAGMDFDLDSFDTGLGEGGESADEADAGLDFDLDMGGGGDAEPAAEEGGLDFDLDMGGEGDLESATEGSGLDFDLDAEGAGEEVAAEGGLDFDLDMGGAEPEEAAADAGGLDFNLDMDAGDEGGLDEGGLDFSMDEFGGEDMAAGAAEGGFEEETLSFDINDAGPAVDESGNIESSEMEGGLDFGADDGSLDFNMGGEEDTSLDFDSGGEEGASLDYAAGGDEGASLDFAAGDDEGASLDFAAGDDEGASLDFAAGDDEGASLDFAAGDDEGVSLDFDSGADEGLSMDLDSGGDEGLSMDLDSGADEGLSMDLDSGGDEGLSMDLDVGGDEGLGMDLDVGGDEGLGMDLDSGGDEGLGMDLDSGGDEGLSMDLDVGGDEGLGMDSGDGDDFSMGLDEGLDESLDLDLGSGDEFDTDTELSMGLGDDLSMSVDEDEGVDMSMDTDFDGEIDESLFADVDEVGTKLDLAKAYIDMGDSDGARSILDEVVEEGNDVQKQEAQELIQQMG